jgi:hypothetical protein
MYKKEIEDIVQHLNELPDVQVIIDEKTMMVGDTNNRLQVAKFHFEWQGQYYAGYFSQKDRLSQAVLSLRTPMDAVNFAGAYEVLHLLRAGRR